MAFNLSTYSGIPSKDAWKAAITTNAFKGKRFDKADVDKVVEEMKKKYTNDNAGRIELEKQIRNGLQKNGPAAVSVAPPGATSGNAGKSPTAAVAAALQTIEVHRKGTVKEVKEKPALIDEADNAIVYVVPTASSKGGRRTRRRGKKSKRTRRHR